MADNTTQDHLSKGKCTPCQGGVPPLSPEQCRDYLEKLDDGWQLLDNRKIEKSYKFKNFAEALDFTNKAGSIAEQQQHHPDIFLTWGKVKITLWTHKIHGLHENDFIMAAKIDNL